MSDAGRSSDFPPEWDVLTLRCVHRKRSTGFEDTKEMPLQPDDVIAGRYQVLAPWGRTPWQPAPPADNQLLMSQQAWPCHAYGTLMGSGTEPGDGWSWHGAKQTCVGCHVTR